MILGHVVFDAKIVKQRFGTALLTHHVKSLKNGTDEAIMRDLFAQLKKQIRSSRRSVHSFSAATFLSGHWGIGLRDFGSDVPGQQFVGPAERVASQTRYFRATGVLT